MSLLVTADWQTRADNLRECEALADRVIALVGEHDVDIVASCGDQKDAYSPLDLRVLHFWRGFVRRIVDAGATPLLLLGNHDRTALTHSDCTWLPSLQDAGAVVFEGVGRHACPDGSALDILPFLSTEEEWKEAVAWLKSAPEFPTQYLLFHETFIGASWNALQTVGESEGRRLSDLDPGRYRLILGGDIHRRQQLRENAWYVGSARAHSWAEANQVKMFALVRDGELSWLPTGAPVWHDPEAPDFRAPEDWAGSKVRISVPAGDDMTHARLKAERERPGATVVLRPRAESAAEIDPAGDSDLDEETHIASYLAALDKDRWRELAAYIRYRLAATAVGQRVGGATFERVRAKNLLCFEELDLRLDTPGITVVTGINHDRPGKSNGSGKTSLLNALPVALFGRTFKGQQADDWRRREGGRKAEAEAWLRLADGTSARVLRTRGPATTRLFLGESEATVGGRQADVGRDIERLCGHEWRTFAATVFLSQEEIGAFLHGTPKERHAMVARLCDLGRFERAEAAVAADQSRTRQQRDSHELELAAATAKRETLAAELGAPDELERAEKVLAEARERLATAEARVPPKPERKTVEKLTRKLERKRRASYAAGVDFEKAEEAAAELRHAPEKCPTCNRPFERDVEAEKARLEKLEAVVETTRAAALEAEAAYHAAERKQAKAASRQSKAEQARRVAETRVAERAGAVEEAEAEVGRWRSKAAAQAAEVERWTHRMQALDAAVRWCIEQEQFLSSARKAVQRDGLPAYLLERRCPRLNAAAERYAELFSDGEIRVRFGVEDGRIGASVINPHGGAGLRDQSTGEGRLAALIASFALRDLVGGGKLLILDEPGAGLDAAGYRALAAGLRRLAADGTRLYVVTHDAGFAMELGDARRLTVEKRQGVAKVVETPI